MIVSGDREQTMDIINAMNPVVFDVLPLTLEEAFTYEMEALGYTFDVKGIRRMNNKKVFSFHMFYRH